MLLRSDCAVSARTRVRGAKERAIAPGPKLDRHPDEEEARRLRSDAPGVQVGGSDGEGVKE